MATTPRKCHGSKARLVIIFHQASIRILMICVEVARIINVI